MHVQSVTEQERQLGLDCVINCNSNLHLICLIKVRKNEEKQVTLIL